MKRGFHSLSKDLLALKEGSTSKSLYIGDSVAFILALRTVLTFATAHTFFTSRDCPRKSGFITVVPAKTLRGKSRSWQGLLESKKKIWGNHTFFRDN